MASSSSSSRLDPGSSSRSYKYNVFLSFRGEDTRRNFVDHLYTALVKKSIITFKDDRGLRAGESISPALFTAVEESQLAVIVFSENYADSSWCLDELTYIMKCKEDRGLIVMPIFYGVEPTEVRNQFGEAFSIHEENTIKAETWRKALVNASNISGFDSKNWHESEFIKKIVDEISRTSCPLYSDIDEKLVGMPTRLQELISQLDLGSDEYVLMVGIWGLGGGGKTTLANSVYMRIFHHFDGCCIVEDIGKESGKKYLKKLQKKILSDVFKEKVKVPSVAEGKTMIKTMLHRRKVLVLLDDIHHMEQLEALVGSHDWFGNGSRIIITTRDKSLLEAPKVNKVCPLELLSTEEAIQLFNKYARNEKEPIKDYETHSSRVVSYAAGLPLTLKVLGSSLRGKNEKQWMSALDRLKDIPERKTVEKLEISYDGLEPDYQELFLEIACFFRWRSHVDIDFDTAREILDACGFHHEIGIKVLREKALINISVDGNFEMHDLVQEMAHYIVKRQHPNNPECYSRIWKEEEIMNLRLEDATEKNDKIEAIGRCYFYDDDVSHFCKNVSNMKRLRWLWVNTHGVHAGDRGPTFLSNQLRYINWDTYPGISFPDSFQPMKLVVLRLSESYQMKVLWQGYKELHCLKELELKYLKNLVSTPNFTGLPCLRRLKLEGCYELQEIHPSLGNRTSLEYVSVVWCGMLRKFPTIVNLEKLQTLEIKNCGKILKFPEIQTNMESLVNLSLYRSKIEVLPSSIGERCTNLTSLYLMYCDNLKIIEFNMDALKCLKEFTFRSASYTQLRLSEKMFHRFPHSLQKLDLSGCCLEDGKVLSGIAELSNLEELDLSCNDFSGLDFSLLQLTLLKILKLEHCRKLVELPKLPSSVAILIANRCHSLTAVGDSLINCRSLCIVSLVDGGKIKDGTRVLESMLQGNIENGTMRLRLWGGLEIAKGFAPTGLCRGKKCRLKLPENWRNEFCGFLMCAVGYTTTIYGGAKIVMKSGLTDSQQEVVWEKNDSDRETWVGYISFASLAHTPWWNQTHNDLSIGITNCLTWINGFGVRLVPKKRESGSGPKYSSQVSKYTSGLKIDNVLPHGLKIDFFFTG